MGGTPDDDAVVLLSCCCWLLLLLLLLPVAPALLPFRVMAFTMLALRFSMSAGSPPSAAAAAAAKEAKEDEEEEDKPVSGSRTKCRRLLLVGVSPDATRPRFSLIL